jgi:hypothetical protein
MHRFPLTFPKIYNRMCRRKLRFASERGADEADSFAARKIAAQKTTQSEKMKLGDRGKKQMQTLTYTVSKAAMAEIFNGSSLFRSPEEPPRLRPSVRSKPDAFFSFQDLADRWRCSRGTVRNRLRAAGAQVLNFGGDRSKKTVAASVVYQIEAKRTKRL